MKNVPHLLPLPRKRQRACSCKCNDASLEARQPVGQQHSGEQVFLVSLLRARKGIGFFNFRHHSQQKALTFHRRTQNEAPTFVWVQDAEEIYSRSKLHRHRNIGRHFIVSVERKNCSAKSNCVKRSGGGGLTSKLWWKWTDASSDCEDNSRNNQCSRDRQRDRSLWTDWNPPIKRTQSNSQVARFVGRRFKLHQIWCHFAGREECGNQSSGLVPRQWQHLAADVADGHHRSLHQFRLRRRWRPLRIKRFVTRILNVYRLNKFIHINIWIHLLNMQIILKQRTALTH